MQRQRSPGREIRGLRFAFYAILCVIVATALLAIPAGVPLRNPTTGSLIGASPFKDSLIVLILVTGLAHGRGATTFTALPQGMAAITKTFSGVGVLIFFCSRSSACSWHTSTCLLYTSPSPRD